MPSDVLLLNPTLDLTSLRAQYRREGRIRIGGLLAGDGAQRLLAHLAGRVDWRQVLNSAEKIL